MSSETLLLAQRYALATEIARGGMATVWQARDEVLARTVAVKILHARLAEDPEFLARFRREAIAAAHLTHPNIVAVYDTGDVPDDGPARHFIVLEHCDRGSLDTLLPDHGPLEGARAAAIGIEICRALAYAHRSGVIHGDIRPGNVLLTSDGSVKVGDFGIAKAALGSGHLAEVKELLGTTRYLSPEQLRGQEPDERSDIYSLGALLYEAVVGRAPFEETALGANAEPRAVPAAPRTRRAGVPRALDVAIMRALAPDPSDRFGSADEMQAALEEVAGEGTVAMPVVRRAATEPSPQRSGDTRWLAPVIALVALAVALAIAVPMLLDEGDGGAVGGGPPAAGGPARQELEVATATSFDPDGDGEEHGDEALLAVDGDPATSWTTEDYQDPLELIGKAGVGLVLDLEETRRVARIDIDGSGGYSIEVRASDSQGTSAEDFELVESLSGMATSVEIPVTPAHEGRYWLVWITSLSEEGGGRATIAEVRFYGG